MKIHPSTLQFLSRGLLRDHTNFVFSQRELCLSFPELDPMAPCDVTPLAEALGPGWHAHGTAMETRGVPERLQRCRNILRRTCDRKVAQERVRELQELSDADDD